PAADAESPTSQPSATRASRSLAAYGAPDAPVIPRKTCTVAVPPSGLPLALGGLEEDRELVEVGLAERLELRHRRARVHARRAFEVVDLELDAEVARPDIG